MGTYRFDTDTAGIAVDETTWQIQLNAEWNVNGTILNGGYLQATAVRAAAMALGAAAAPVAVSTIFVTAARAGAALVHIDILRTGRSITSVSASVTQDDTVVLRSLITFGSSPVAAPASEPSIRMPTVTNSRDSIRVPAQQLPGPPGLTKLIDYAFVPESSGWLRGDFSQGPTMQCWISFQDGRPIDVFAAVAFVDIAPPVCFALGQFGWAPTLQLQVGVFATPTDGPMLLQLHGEPYDGPVVAEDALLWDAAGTLIARSRQVALAPRTT